MKQIMRLNKFLARSGIASRRKCDTFIETGKVVINGKVNRDFSFQVSPDDVVVCDGHTLDSMPPRRVYLLNKLKGYISTSEDPQGRKKVIDLIPVDERLFTIGRLDRDTTGAIVVTNDGELANVLMHPKNQIERIYIAATKIDIPRERHHLLSKGIHLDDGSISKGDLTRLEKRGGLIYWKVILKRGRKHEVKRIFVALDSKVIHLHRQSFAGFHVDNLAPGKFRLLKKHEVKKLEQGK